MKRRALTVAVLLWGATVSAAPPAGRGKVRYVSAKRTYVDVGERDGLRVGTNLRIARKGRTLASCAIDQVGDHTASCPIGSPRVGDVVSFEANTSPKAVAPVALPAPPTSADVARAQATLSGSAVDLVDFHGSSSNRSLTQGLPFVSLTVSHDAYVSFGGGQYQQERLDLSLNGVSIKWAGFRAFAHLTAVIASVRPDTQRFRAGDTAQIYVWETALSSREVGRPFTLSIGRVAPYHTPGLSLLDGAQVGWRSKHADAEVGVYGGTIPDVITLYPTYDHWTGGIYYAHSLARSKKSVLRLLHTEGRLGLRGAPGVGPQLELEWQIQAALAGKVDIGAQARASIGADDWSRPHVESARAHIAIHPIDALRVIATVRYLGPRPVDFDAFTSRYFTPSNGFFTTSHMVHGTLDAIWDIRPWVTLMLQAGVDHDSDSGNGRQYFGPELMFPRVFGRAGGLGLGYREELGWYSGREAHLQFTSSGLDRIRAIVRASYLEDRLGGGFTSPTQRELGVYGMAEAKIVRWFSIRASAIARIGIESPGGANASGLTARLDLIGSL